MSPTEGNHTCGLCGRFPCHCVSCVIAVDLPKTPKRNCSTHAMAAKWKVHWNEIQNESCTLRKWWNNRINCVESHVSLHADGTGPNIYFHGRLSKRREGLQHFKEGCGLFDVVKFDTKIYLIILLSIRDCKKTHTGFTRQFWMCVSLIFSHDEMQLEM